MMGFDWVSFGFETANFVVLVVLLQRLVYRPLRDGLRKRRAEMEAERKELKQALSDAQAKADEAKERLEELGEMRAKALRQATEEANVQRARMIDEARQEAAAERARVDKLLETERASAQAWVRDVAIERGSEVASYLLTKLVPEALGTSLWTRLLDTLTDRADRLREAAGGEKSVEVQVTCAQLPTDAEVRSLRATLAEIFEQPARLVLEEDPELGAGAVVRVGYYALDSSIAGHLAAYRDDVRAHLMAEQGSV